MKERSYMIAEIAKELVETEGLLEIWNARQIESYNLYDEYKRKSEKEYEKYNDARSMVRELNTKMVDLKKQMREAIFEQFGEKGYDDPDRGL